MNTELLKTLGQVAGIGGIALGVFLIIFLELVRKSRFPSLPKEKVYPFLRLITILVFIVTLAGIGAWVWVEKSPDVNVSHGIGAGRDINVGRDIRIEGKSKDSED